MKMPRAGAWSATWRTTPGWLRAVMALALPIFCYGLYLRFGNLRDVLCREPDEFSELMPGLRLHGLPLFNFRDAVRYNFFQSMFYSHHGLGDVSFYYLASSALNLLGLPISERWLFAAGGVANAGLALAGAVLCGRLLGSRGAGWLFALLVWLSPYFVFISNSGWARLTWTPLLLILLFLVQERAMRARGRLWAVTFCLLAGFVSLTDGFIVFPIVIVLGVLLVDGDRLRERLTRLRRDRIFVAGLFVFALGIAFELLIGLGARRRGTDLTMIAYVIFKGGSGAWLPTTDVMRLWAHAVDAYFPVRGAWILVTVACLFAVAEGRRGRAIGFVAAWWLLASLAVIRYAAGQGPGPSASWLNAYNLAVPSLLLVAWMAAAIVEGHLPGLRRASSSARLASVSAILLPMMIMMGVQAHTVAFSATEEYGVSIGELALGTAGAAGDEFRRRSPAIAAPSLRACRALKAAAFYVRSSDADLPYVFQLSSNVYLSFIGEFYYGLSYSRSSRPEDPNHLLDFGLNQFDREYAPQAFYRAYGVTHFDYYVDLFDDRNPFKSRVVSQLQADGARVVCTIRERGRPIAAILSFRREPPIELDADEAARAWDRQFAHPRTLLRQPLAGTAYHFGYNWRAPE
jgi:hypothetical protein